MYWCVICQLRSVLNHFGFSGHICKYILVKSFSICRWSSDRFSPNLTSGTLYFWYNPQPWVSILVNHSRPANVVVASSMLLESTTSTSGFLAIYVFNIFVNVVRLCFGPHPYSVVGSAGHT